jgi:hypothetical protein
MPKSHCQQNQGQTSPMSRRFPFGNVASQGPSKIYVVCRTLIFSRSVEVATEAGDFNLAPALGLGCLLWNGFSLELRNQ